MRTKARALVCLILAASSLAPVLGAERLTLAAIPKSTGGEFWETVERGARRAAQDLGVTLKWEGTVTETEIAEQNNLPCIYLVDSGG
ncbi:MAG TPA: hypothetical protein PKH32_04095, partial [Verrucomicrobiota bacterium]|nr:hypothetical protein [Verrucomicrobiota bacterium]